MRVSVTPPWCGRALFIVLATMLLGAAAWGPEAPPSPTAAPAPTTAPAAKPAATTAQAAKPAEPAVKAAKKLVQIDFAMPWILPTEYFYLIIADEKGFYREEGIQINLNEGSGSGNAVKIVGAGSSPLGLADANRILAGRVRGVPIKSIMAYYYTSPVLVTSMADKPIKTLAELYGKKLGEAPDSANLLIWRAAMKRAGLDPEKVNLVNIDAKAKHQLLLAGRVDASLEQSGVARLQAEGYKIHNLLITEDAGFEVVADSFFANEDFLKKSPEVVRGFLRATIKGIQYGREHQDEVIAATLKRAPTFTKKQLELQYKLEDSWIFTTFTPKDRFGVQSLQSWSNLQDILFENGQIDKRIDLKELVDNSYLP
jgi:NitT/TauT family transport system substrate-binding protein